MNRRHDDEPILITEAKQSPAEEFSARKKRYSIIMACRIPCLVLAGVFSIAFNMNLVAVLFVILSVPLPWVAVLIANDRTPQKAGRVNKYQQRATRLENHDRKLIEAAEVLDARESRRPYEGQVFDAGPAPREQPAARPEPSGSADRDRPSGGHDAARPGSDRRAG